MKPGTKQRRENHLHAHIPSTMFFSMLKPFPPTTRTRVPVLLQNTPLHVLPSLCSEILVGYLVNYKRRIWVADEVAGTQPWLKPISPLRAVAGSVSWCSQKRGAEHLAAAVVKAFPGGALLPALVVTTHSSESTCPSLQNRPTRPGWRRILNHFLLGSEGCWNVAFPCTSWHEQSCCFISNLANNKSGSRKLWLQTSGAGDGLILGLNPPQNVTGVSHHRSLALKSKAQPQDNAGC